MEPYVQRDCQIEISMKKRPFSQQTQPAVAHLLSRSSFSSGSVTAGGGGGGGGGGTGDVLFPFKPAGEIVTVSVLGWLSMKGKSVKCISNKRGMKKE